MVCESEATPIHNREKMGQNMETMLYRMSLLFQEPLLLFVDPRGIEIDLMFKDQLPMLIQKANYLN